jgi:hypothetical protein
VQLETRATRIVTVTLQQPMSDWATVGMVRGYVSWWARSIEARVQRAVVAHAARIGVEPTALPRFASVPAEEIFRELKRQRLGDDAALRELAQRIWIESDEGCFDLAVDEIEKALPKRRGAR